MPQDATRRLRAIRDELADAVLVAVVRETSEARAEALVEALLEAGIRALEITATTPGCFEILKRLAGGAPGSTLGAGTVLSAEDAVRAADAGVSFVVSPHTDAAVVDAAHRAGLVAIPGALTPTEIVAAHRG